MTAHAATATRTRTGGPGEDGPKIVEQVLGWVLVAVVAMLVTRLGLL
ncbi:SCO1431 family membrane protein [Streptomyces griseoruber]|nr:SCO1431 family membrane protein [Streptomyces griseoruber]